MAKVNEHLKTSAARVELLKNQKKSKERREQEARRKMDTYRNIIIGELVCKFFPDVMRYQPQSRRADNTTEFAELSNILRLLSNETEFLYKVKKEATEQTVKS